MSRFVAPDLGALGALPLVPVDYEAAETRRVEYLKAALTAYGIDWDVEALETDPLRIAFTEGGAWPEMLLDQRINESIRKNFITTDDIAALRHIAATYYGISQQVDVDDQGNEVLEDIERFRDRIVLAPEAFSTAGPEGAYTFHTLELDGEQDIADAYTYGEEDEATYSDTLHADAYSVGKRSTPFGGRDDGDPVRAPEILVVAVPSVAYGAMDQDLLDRAWWAVTSKDVRPLGDNVRVESAEVIDYAVDMTITYALGADPEPLIAQAAAAAGIYVANRRRVGVKAERLGIGGCGYVSGVETVTLTSPATDVGGGSKQVPNCTGITVTAVQSEGSWQ